MDFFEAQARAHRRTARLILLFVLAVLGTVFAGYAGAVLFVRELGGKGYRQRALVPVAAQFDAGFWHPRLFYSVALGTISVIGLASLYKWFRFRAGGASVAESVGGRRVEPGTGDLSERRLLNVVEEMAIASGVPVPAIYVLDEPAINAFAAGLTTSDAVVAVTAGALAKLSRDELQGVIGHEFSHILNGDMRLNVRLSAIVFGILVIGLIGRGIVQGFSRGRIRGRGKGAGGVLLVLAAGIAILAIGYVGYFFGRLIQAAVSRQREFLADAAAVQFTRNPEGIAGALKKIGGYAQGSSLESSRSAALGHFFFAQCFRSSFGGLWATHPPLPERIRAIDPRFDGRMFESPQPVDPSGGSAAAIGLTGGGTDIETTAAPPPIVRTPASDRPSGRIEPAALISAAGTLTPGQLAEARRFLESMPPRLRQAVHATTEAPILVCALLLNADPEVRAAQRKLVTEGAGSDAAGLLGELEPALAGLSPSDRLPLLQLSLPALRRLPAAELQGVLGLLDQLVHADRTVSTFEFALQKVLTHTLALGKNPGSAIIQYNSFHAVTREISTVLSALALAATKSPADAPTAFLAGATQLKAIEDRLRFHPEEAADLSSLDAALDKLAVSSLPIKQRTLTAAAAVVSADGQVLLVEAELLRAIAAALDIPLPPLPPPARDDP